MSRWRNPQKRQNISITWDTSVSAYRIKMNYDEDLVKLIKQYVSAQHRVWEPQSKTWLIEEQYFDALRDLFNALQPGHVTVEPRYVTERKLRDAEARFKDSLPKTKDTPSVEDARREFYSLSKELGVGMGPIENVDFDYEKRLYRKMAILLHPDKGGDSVKMARLNTCWKVLQEHNKPKQEGGSQCQTAATTTTS